MWFLDPKNIEKMVSFIILTLSVFLVKIFLFFIFFDPLGQKLRIGQLVSNHGLFCTLWPCKKIFQTFLKGGWGRFTQAGLWTIWIISLYYKKIEKYKSRINNQKIKNCTTFRKEISWIFPKKYQKYVSFCENTKKLAPNQKIAKNQFQWYLGDLSVTLEV